MDNNNTIVVSKVNAIQEELEKPQRANLLLSDVLKGFDSALQNSWELADAELKLRKPNDEIAEIAILNKTGEQTGKWIECKIIELNDTTGKYTVEVKNKKDELIMHKDISIEHLQKIQP